MDIIIDSSETNGALSELFETVHFVGGPEGDELPEVSWPDDDEDEEGSEDPEEKSALLRCTGCGKTYAADNEEEMHDHWTSHDEAGEKGIRYVRTPEGAAYYGQPIGTPIVAGTGITAAPNVPERLRVRRSRARGTSDLPLPDKAPKIKWKDNGYSRYMSSNYEGYTLAVSQRYVEGGDQFEWSVYGPGGGRAGSSRVIANGYAIDQETAKKAAEDVAIKRAKERQNRVKRSYENIMEMWPGTYGYDWVYPNDEIDPDPDRIESDPEYRDEIAIRHSEKMGLQVVLDDGAYAPLDINAHETLNSVLAVHEDLFPGFIELFDSIGTTGNTNVYGYNKVSQFGFGETPDDHRPTKTALRFGVNTFGDVDGAYESVASSKKRAGEIGWSACKIDRLQAANPDDEDWRLAMMTTMVHEIGHTVARVVIGEMGAYPNGERYDRYSLSNSHAGEFVATLKEYFDYYEITKNDMEDYEFSGAVHSGLHQGGSMSAINRNTISEMVSQYGSSSFHEMFAEVWAEYMLDDEPREFVQEIGNLMEANMLSWLEDKKKFMTKKGNK